MFNFTIEKDISASSQCKPVGFQNKLLGGIHRHAGRQGIKKGLRLSRVNLTI